MKRSAQKKTSPGGKPAPSGGKPPKPAKAAVSVRATAVKPRPAAKPAAAAPAAVEPQPDLLREIREVRALVAQLLAPPPSGDAALESGVDSLRRVLSELLEARLESVAAGLAVIRAMAARNDARLLDRVDRLLDELGAVRFEAVRLEHLDPLIHQVAGERAEAGAPDGTVLATVQPGHRTARGVVLAKATVIVNRRT